jgi:hypothetical protein
MTILDKLFGGGKVQATAERTEAELQARLAAVDAALAAGTGDVLALMEEREGLRLAVQAAAHTRQAREQAEYRAKVTEQANELRGRLNESLDELGDLVPRVLLACSHFHTIVAEVQAKGLGFNPGAALLEDVFCVPPDFGSSLIAAIREIAPRTEWDYGHTGPFANGRKAERPKLRGPQAIRVPQFYNPPPHGYSGLWDPIKGEPVDGEGAA